MLALHSCGLSFLSNWWCRVTVDELVQDIFAVDPQWVGETWKDLRRLENLSCEFSRKVKRCKHAKSEFTCSRDATYWWWNSISATSTSAILATETEKDRGDRDPEECFSHQIMAKVIVWIGAESVPYSWISQIYGYWKIVCQLIFWTTVYNSAPMPKMSEGDWWMADLFCFLGHF